MGENATLRMGGSGERGWCHWQFVACMILDSDAQSVVGLAQCPDSGSDTRARPSTHPTPSSLHPLSQLRFLRIRGSLTAAGLGTSNSGFTTTAALTRSERI